MSATERFITPASSSKMRRCHNLEASFTAKTDATGMLIEGSVPLKRNDFKIGDGPWADTTVVANEVLVKFKVLLKK